jgi:hypothetical protein
MCISARVDYGIACAKFAGPFNLLKNSFHGFLLEKRVGLETKIIVL